MDTLIISFQVVPLKLRISELQVCTATKGPIRRLGWSQHLLRKLSELDLGLDLVPQRQSGVLAWGLGPDSRDG